MTARRAGAALALATALALTPSLPAAAHQGPWWDTHGFSLASEKPGNGKAKGHEKRQERDPDWLWPWERDWWQDRHDRDEQPEPEQPEQEPDQPEVVPDPQPEPEPVVTEDPAPDPQPEPEPEPTTEPEPVVTQDPEPAPAPEETTPPAAEEDVRTGFITGYTFHNNDPNNSRALAHSTEWNDKALHTESGGTGTWEDPITVATTPGTWEVGTRFYLPHLDRYFIMENDCATCGDRDPWLDVWIGGDEWDSAEATYACAEQITGDYPFIVNPAPDHHVVSGPLYDSATDTCYTPTP